MGHDWVTREFYRPWRMARRLVRHLLRPRPWAGLTAYLAINLAYYGRVLRWKIRGWDPARQKGHDSQSSTGLAPHFDCGRTVDAAATVTKGWVRTS